MQGIANTKIEIFCGFLSATLTRHGRPISEALNDEAVMNAEDEITDIESSRYGNNGKGARKLPVWIKVTTMTVASVLAGGLAAAWIYRKSIARLQNSVETEEYSNSSIPDREADDEV
jgi:hypothetical protein